MSYFFHGNFDMHFLSHQLFKSIWLRPILILYDEVLILVTLLASVTPHLIFIRVIHHHLIFWLSQFHISDSNSQNLLQSYRFTDQFS